MASNEAFFIEALSVERWALGVEKRRSIAALAPRCRLRAGSQKLALFADLPFSVL